jgi:hypothetical protein
LPVHRVLDGPDSAQDKPEPGRARSLSSKAPTQAKAIRLLTLGTSQDVEEANGALTLTVPSILMHEVVAIDL